MPTIASLTSTAGTFRLLPNSSDKIFVFDIETDGLLYDKASPVSRIWCIVIYDCKQKTYFHYKPDTIDAGLAHLNQADILIGHNIIAYDLPVIQKIYPDWHCKAQLIDTFVLGNLIYPKDKLYIQDQSFYPHLDASLKGSQSLRAWGQRLQNRKGDHSDWSAFSEEMLSYCQNDVLVTTLLYTYLVKSIAERDPDFKDLRSLAIEHDISQILALQVDTGWTFDVDQALELNDELKNKLLLIEQELKTLIPDDIIETVFVPAKNNKVKGWVKGEAVTKIKRIPFNPGSRQQILKFFKTKYDWTPSDHTDKGNPKLNDDTLSELPFPEAKKLAEYFLLQKRIGQLSDGSKAWLSLVDADNRIHGSIISNGCVSGRASHQSPNLGQVPNTDSPYGAECRSLFKPRDGFLLLGSDAKALELRCLGGYLAHFDDGEYAAKVIDPDVDIHSYNQEKFGVENRSIAKRLIYCVPVDGTEVLTKEGWKTYQELRLTDQVLTYNQSKRYQEWSAIQAIISPFDDEVYSISNGTNFTVYATANHRWFAVNLHGQDYVTTTTNLNPNHGLLTNASLAPEISWDPAVDPLLPVRTVVSLKDVTVEPMGVASVFCLMTANTSFVMRQGKSRTITGNCVLYGGGSAKVGSIIEPHASLDRQKQIGSSTLNNFYKEIPALKKLKDSVELAIQSKGYLRGIDGRELYVRSSHKGLNLLLQSAGAIIMKRVGIEMYERLTQAGMEYGIDWCQQAFVHDEYQISVLSSCINQARELVLASYPAAGQFLSFPCPIEGDVKIGTNWYETH